MKKKNKDFDSEEVKNWVVGKEFSKIKLMDLLTEVDLLETSSEFGFESFDEIIKNNKLSKQEIDHNKIVSFKLLIFKLIQIIRNTDFAMKQDRKKMQKYLKNLKIIDSMIPKIYTKISDKKVRLKPTYSRFLAIVKEIKCKINFPLNRNNLIYMNREEVSIEQLKRESIYKASTAG